MKKRVSMVFVILVLVSCTVNKPSHYRDEISFHEQHPALPKTPSDKIEAASVSSENGNKQVIDPTLIEHNPIQERTVSKIRQPRLHPRKIKNILEKQTSYAASADKINRSKVNTVASAPRRNGDRLLYLMAALMGIAVIGLTRLFRPVATRITRWAKANPKTTQSVIAGIHLPLLGLGLMNGYNLYQLGYDTSDTMMYTFWGATLLSLLLSPFKTSRSTIALPRQVNFQRMAFAGLTISSLMMAVGLGNHIESDYSDTRFAQAVRYVDHTMHGIDSYPVANVVQDDRIQAARKSTTPISSGAAVVGTILLVLLACTGLCLIIGAVAGAFATAGAAVAAGIGGAALLFLAVKGMNDISKRRKATREMERQQEKQKGQ